jgi:hypothetical protein
VFAPEGIEIDPATQSGTVLLEFSNDEDRATAAFELHATPLRSVVTHRRIGAIVRFADATAGEGDAKLAYPLSLGPHEHRLVRAFISNMREAGAAEGELRWGGETLAPVAGGPCRAGRGAPASGLAHRLGAAGASRSPRPLPPALVSIVERCLAKDPAQRFPSTQALLAALEPLSRAPAS